MLREDTFAKLESESRRWDVVVIGGGATGLGTALESASRGYKTLLLEQHDFSKGTSSRSTKLIHGGVRYLRQGNIHLVLDALHERGLLMQNAPHLVHRQSFVVPNYHWWSAPFYGAGLKLYDMLAGKLGLGPSKLLSKKKTLDTIPNVEPEGLRSGILYYDGQFDDSRLAINLATTICDVGGSALNYMKVTGLLKRHGMMDGVVAVDQENAKEYQINSRVVINATGVFTDDVLKMDDPDASDLVVVSQGVHLVLDREYLAGDSAIMIPHAVDGRVFFAVPWHDKVVVGTTDTPLETVSLEPRAIEDEIEFILHHAAKYMMKDPDRKDVKSVFAGLRPLVKPAHSKKTAAISRDHFLAVSQSGLVTITGGKWTTYRKMGEDTINQAAIVAGLKQKPGKTANLRIHGWLENEDIHNPLYVYGSDITNIENLIADNPELGGQIHPALPYRKAEIIWHVRNEMARTVEDVLARRTRALFLDAKASIEMAPTVAELISNELNLKEGQLDQQIVQFTSLAKEYLLI